MTFDDLTTTKYDDFFNLVPDLAWHPWVGVHYPFREVNEKLLVVGESHYVPASREEDLEVILERYKHSKLHTREVILECPVRREWRNHTLENVIRLFFADAKIQDSKFWSDIAYYNFVQRLMDYRVVERPTWEDFVRGWKVFEAVVEILKPTCCVFIGVEAANSLAWYLQERGSSFSGVIKVEKVGRTWGRRASIPIAGKSIELCFVKHAGSYFAWSDWNQYLKKHYPDLMSWLNRGNY